MIKPLEEIGQIDSIYSENITTDKSFIDIASLFSGMTGTVCLMSGGDLDCSNYHILAIKPWLTFYGTGTKMELQINDEYHTIESDPFDMLRFITNSYSVPTNVPAPIQSGLFGYLSYDLKDYIEVIQSSTINDLELPEIWFSAPEIILIQDKHTGTLTVYIPQFAKTGYRKVDETLKWFRERLTDQPKSDNYSGANQGFHSNFTESTYKSAIESIKEYIRSGDIYQVNMSQRFTTDFTGNPFSLFKALYQANPAPFFAYLNCDTHHLVSTSPERFIQLKGTQVESRPIKGTRPRGQSTDEDNRLKSELKSSKKDDAELSMIVDLMRNDIGKVCDSGSVYVKEHKRVEAYQNVFHLISIVEGKLHQDYDAIDLIRATFPGGSITGCPKIRSMEIIDELESNKRHIYTGSIGYISFHDTMDLSIAIRTATVLNNHLIFSVGGGIVYDSDPQSEYEETLHKGKTLLNAFTTNTDQKTPEIVWDNGLFKPVSDCSIPLSDPGFYYGFGFFETLRADKGKIYFLEDHIDRLKKAWKSFYPSAFPRLSFEQIIFNLLKINGLLSETAVIKILTTHGGNESPPFANKIIITAKKYSERKAHTEKTGLDLVIFPQKRHTFIADYKSLNYAFYMLAGKYANKMGYDEALIKNGDGSISETNTANIVLIRNKEVVLPMSEHLLRGTMEARVVEQFKINGFRVTTKKIFEKDIYDFDRILLTNSLIGTLPVKRINNHQLKYNYSFSQMNNPLKQRLISK